MGVCFSVERWDVQTSAPLKEDAAASPDVSGGGAAGHAQAATDCYGPVSGQLIAVMKEACRQAFQAQPQRLMAAMYTCEIVATADVLGKLLPQDKLHSSSWRGVQRYQYSSLLTVFSSSRSGLRRFGEEGGSSPPRGDEGGDGRFHHQSGSSRRRELRLRR